MHDREQRPASSPTRAARPARTSPDRGGRMPPGGPLTPSTALAMQQLVGNTAVAAALGSDVQRSPSRPAPAAENTTHRAGTPPVQRMDQVRQEPQGPSLAVDFPKTPEPKWWQLCFCRATEDPAEEWNQFLTELQSIHPSAFNDPQVVFDQRQRSVLVNYDTKTLGDLYPHLVLLLSRQAREHLTEQPTKTGEALSAFGRQSGRTRGYWSTQDDRETRLRRESAAQARGFANTGAPHDPLAGQPAAPATALHALLQNPNADGFLIGENHKKPDAYYFLANNLQAARAAGLRTIYLEVIRKGDPQSWVDEYLDNSSTQMSPQLTAFLTRQEADKNHDGLRTLLRAVKTAGGVRVQGVDTLIAERRSVQSANQQVSADWSLHKRAAMMNTFAADAVQQDQASAPGKYVIVVGEAHAGHHDFTGDRATLQNEPADLVGDVANPGLPDRIPGLAHYLGIPAVRVSDPSAAVPIESIPL